jgi:hypothetical protein
MDKSNIIILIYIIVLVVVAFIIACLRTASNADDNSCSCDDVNQCEKWCNAKIAYTKHNNFSISEECKHTNQLTRVLEASGTCETTIEICADCGEPLSEPKTDCI